MKGKSVVKQTGTTPTGGWINNKTLLQDLHLLYVVLLLKRLADALYRPKSAIKSRATTTCCQRTTMQKRCSEIFLPLLLISRCLVNRKIVGSTDLFERATYMVVELGGPVPTPLMDCRQIKKWQKWHEQFESGSKDRVDASRCYLAFAHNRPVN